MNKQEVISKHPNALMFEYNGQPMINPDPAKGRTIFAEVEPDQYTEFYDIMTADRHLLRYRCQQGMRCRQ